MKRLRPVLVFSFLAASFLPFTGPSEFVASAVTPTSFSFGASGDHAGNSNTSASLDALANAGTDFYLGLGDLSYGQMLPELAWCDYIKGKVGPAYPFEIVSGNHEDDGPDGLVSNFSTCLPDRMGNIVGQYSKEFYFDYPPTSPLARMILISPNLTFPGETTYSYNKGTTRYQWVSDNIDAARSAGIPWVIVGMHKNCITAGGKSCEIGKDLMNLLVGKKVDLILQGHEHNYQRSKQLALTPTCTAVPILAFNAGCVADDGGDGLYTKGAGSVIAIVGTFGRGGDVINPNDPEAGYFAKSMSGTANGFVRYQVSADQLSAQFVYSAGVPFSDSFTIGQVDSAVPTLSINDVTVAEGNSATSTALFNVSLSAPSTQTVTVNFATANNTASDPSDYLGTSGTATFLPGTTTQVVPVAVNGDTDNEPNEDFFVNLSGAINGNIADSQGVATITNDDGPPIVTKTFTPSADATILSTSPTTNYGSLVKIEADNSPVQHFMIKFSAPELAGKTIVSAKLRLFCLDTSPKGGDFHKVSDVLWSEQTLNWNNAPAYEAATIASLGSATPNLWYEIDLTSLVRDEALTGDGIFSLRANSTSSDGVDWASKEKGAASAPQLVVTYS